MKTNEYIIKYLEQAIELEANIDKISKILEEGDELTPRFGDKPRFIPISNRIHFSNEEYEKLNKEKEALVKKKDELNQKVLDLKKPKNVALSARDYIDIYGFIVPLLAFVFYAVGWMILSNFMSFGTAFKYITYVIVGGLVVFVIPFLIQKQSKHKKMVETRSKESENLSKELKTVDDKLNNVLIKMNIIDQDIYAAEVNRYNQNCEIIRNNVFYAKKKIEELNVPRRMLAGTLKKLYDMNVIYPKYRNLIALCTIFEYFKSGRCYELEGPNGAYNIFEYELRQNLIIDKLDEVLSNLAVIRNNQMMLYKKLEDINSTLNKIRVSVNTIQNVSIDIAKTTKKIEANTKATALFSALTAQYAEATSKNTEALKYIALIKQA